MDKTIQCVIERNLCMGCGTCAGLCPSMAVTMRLDMHRGEFRPELDPHACNNCGLCYEICPGHTVDLGETCRNLWGIEPMDSETGHYSSAHIAYATNEKIRNGCSSGGMVTTLLIHALLNGLIDGAVVTRMCPSRPWQPEAFIARSPEEVLSAKGSKYSPVPVNLALREITDNDGRYALVGLPCHVYALRLAQQRMKILQDRVVMVLGLFCAGGRNFKGLQSLLQQAGLELGDVAAMSYRGQGWPGDIVIETHGGRTVSCSYDVGYPFMCLTDIRRCTFCPDKGSELADLSFGDLWLPEERDGIGAGKSVVIVRSPVGNDLMQRAAGRREIRISPLDQGQVVRAVNPYNKKTGAAARHKLAEILRRPVPVLRNSGLQPCHPKDYVKAANSLALQCVCRHDGLRRLYLGFRPKYRQLRQRIVFEKP